MHAGPLLSSEPLSRYRALGLAGDPVWRAAGQLRAAVASRLSPSHADLLAIPEVDPSGRRIDWYAAFDGQSVRKLTDLSESDRIAILARVQSLHADLSRLADTMEAADRSGAERNFARLLRHALTAPGEDTLYAVDGKPVMTFWGFTADAALPGVFIASPPVVGIPGGPVAALHAAARPGAGAVLVSAPAIAGPQPMRSVWWQWLLLLALLLLILAALAWLVKPYLPRLEPRLEAEVRDRALAMSVQRPAELQQARVDTLQNDSERLRLELARLTDELSRKGGDCSAGVIGPGGVIVGTAPVAAIAGAGPDAAMVARADGKQAAPPIANAPIERGVSLDRQGNTPGANTPDLNKTDQGKPDSGKAGANREMAKKDEPKPMVVPPEAKKKEELAFLKGDWRSRTGLATAQGENDIRPSYTLDDKGKGKVSFVQKNGATCEAPAEARWAGGKLVIEEKSNPRCSDGRTYARNTVNCEVGPDGAAQCKGSQPGDPRTYSVQIGR